ncbi:MAG: YciI family protein [Streptococcaceae bacterium]|jgi:hypothetical protein|nr:YciI family protein [Streptococcaceae bacterium]
MKKFMFIYRADMKTAAEMGANMTPEDMEKMNQAWMAWGGKVGAALLDFGNPTMPTEFAVDQTVGGYSILEAESAEAAHALTEGHPHIAMGGSIDIYEIMPTPGM